MFKKFAETPLTMWIALAVVVALCVIFAALVKTRRGNTNKDNAKLTGQIVSLIEKWKK